MALSSLFDLSIQSSMPFSAIFKLRTAQNLYDWIFVTCFQKRTPCGLPAGSAHQEHLQSLIFCGLLRPSTHPLPKPFPLPPHPSRCVLLGRGCGIYGSARSARRSQSMLREATPPLGVALCIRGALFAWAAPQNGFVFPFPQSPDQDRSALIARFARTRASLAALFARRALLARYAPPLPRFASGRRFNSPALAWRRPLFPGNKNPSKTAIGYLQKIAAARSPRACAKRTPPSAHPRQKIFC